MKLSLASARKNLKRLNYHLQHAPFSLLPYAIKRKNREALLREFRALPKETQQTIQQRVDYYNKLSHTPQSFDTHEVVAHFQRRPEWGSFYFYDLGKLLPYFPADARFNCEFGDVNYIPTLPAFCKSRPITANADNANAVLLKLDSFRHFYIEHDPYTFAEKQAKLVWRGSAYQPWRTRFLEQYHNHPLCDIGCVVDVSKNTPYHRAEMSIAQQLRYRYIMSIEGNDVATNLKWIMASRSVVVMPRPKYETWLMEGRLQANVHYIEVQDDYADLAEKIHFYEQHHAATEKIVHQAQAWMQPFFHRKQELITSILVMQKYFNAQA